MPVIVLSILHLPLLGIHSRARLVPGRGRADPRLRLGHLEPKVLELEVPTPEARPFGARKYSKMEVPILKRMDLGRKLGIGNNVLTERRPLGAKSGVGPGR